MQAKKLREKLRERLGPTKGGNMSSRTGRGVSKFWVFYIFFSGKQLGPPDLIGKNKLVPTVCTSLFEQGNPKSTDKVGRELASPDRALGEQGGPESYELWSREAEPMVSFP